MTSLHPLQFALSILHIHLLVLIIQLHMELISGMLFVQLKESIDHLYVSLRIYSYRVEEKEKEEKKNKSFKCRSSNSGGKQNSEHIAVAPLPESCAFIYVYMTTKELSSCPMDYSIWRRMTGCFLPGNFVVSRNAYWGEMKENIDRERATYLGTWTRRVGGRGGGGKKIGRYIVRYSCRNVGHSYRIAPLVVSVYYYSSLGRGFLKD